MRFHKAESAFFVFITLVLAAGVILAHAYDLLSTSVAALRDAESIPYVVRLIFGTGVLLATAVVFGIFFIYPLIRRQVRAPRQSPRRKDGIFGDHGLGIARKGVVAKRKSLWPDAAMASIFFSLISKVTS